MKCAVSILTGVLVAGRCLAGDLTPEQLQSLPPAAPGPVDFTKDIRPILEASCVKCHARGKAKGGFSLETRESLLKGGDSGPAMVEGRSADSHLIALVAAVDEDNVMPLKGSRLSAEEVGLLRAWIDRGAAWDPETTFAKPPPLNLKPRRPDLPPGEGHPVDRLLASYLREHNVRPGPVVEDRMFARRVYLDLIGLLPAPDELEAFVADTRPNKRVRLVDRLLADRERYAEHWLTFWNDLLRNDYRGTGYIDDGRKQISAWLFDALVSNKPFDRFVSELINPDEASEGFVKGIVWRGAVNASQKPEMQAAQNISQVFMGVNLKCASCHDSFINDWALADAYALASVYAEKPLEMFRCDKPTGEMAGVAFLYPELGAIPAEADQKARQKRLAEIMTSRENGRLTRTLVNRIWQRLMGYGLVEPIDDMEQPGWNPDLLDWLAEDFVAGGHDMKQLLRRITTSQAYQLQAVGLPEQPGADYVFAGPAIRRMSAEQYRDALAQVTGVWFEMPEAEVNFAAAAPGGDTSRVLAVEPQWIWDTAEAAAKAPPGTVFFRKTFDLAEVPDEAMVVATCDNKLDLYLNGEKVLSNNDHKKPRFALVQGRLRAGANLLAVEATNDKTKDAKDRGDNPAGLLVYLWMLKDGREYVVASDGSWRCSADKVEDWAKPDAELRGWASAQALGGPRAEPWKVAEAFERALTTVFVHHEVRASLVASDPLMRALGRPPREQLLTQRASAATTLQGLELTNGNTLNDLLGQAADRMLSANSQPAGPLASAVFERALGRAPTREELDLTVALLGNPVRREGLQDLLWSVAMLPEFQLIY